MLWLALITACMVFTRRTTKQLAVLEQKVETLQRIPGPIGPAGAIGPGVEAPRCARRFSVSSLRLDLTLPLLENNWSMSGQSTRFTHCQLQKSNSANTARYGSSSHTSGGAMQTSILTKPSRLYQTLGILERQLAGRSSQVSVHFTSTSKHSPCTNVSLRIIRSEYCIAWMFI